MCLFGCINRSLTNNHLVPARLGYLNFESPVGRQVAELPPPAVSVDRADAAELSDYPSQGRPDD
jgi:hypothetical protein